MILMFSAVPDLKQRVLHNSHANDGSEKSPFQAERSRLVLNLHDGDFLIRGRVIKRENSE